MKFKILIILLGLTTRPLFALEPVEPEVLEAAFIYNFIKYTDFSHLKNGLNLCIEENPRLEEVVREKLEGKKIQGHPLTIQSLEKNSVCHILFLTNKELKGEEYEQYQLTISRIPQKRAIIILERQNRKITFKVNLDALKRSQLEISSKVLRLAKEVIK